MEPSPRCHRALPGACLVLAAGVSEPGDAGGREEQVESHGQEGQVPQQLEALPAQDGLAQQVGEAQPLQGQADRAEAGVTQLHVQEIVVQTLEAGAGLEVARGRVPSQHPSEPRLLSWPYLGELLLLPRGDGEVQDAVEAVGGRVAASCRPEE